MIIKPVDEIREDLIQHKVDMCKDPLYLRNLIASLYKSKTEAELNAEHETLFSENNMGDA